MTAEFKNLLIKLGIEPKEVQEKFDNKTDQLFTDDICEVLVKYLPNFNEKINAENIVYLIDDLDFIFNKADEINIYTDKVKFDIDDAVEQFFNAQDRHSNQFYTNKQPFLMFELAILALTQKYDFA